MIINPDLYQEITQLADLLRAKFSPTEFIPGCLVKSVTDKSQYATNNGWIEAVCGQHNQQRVRWKSNETVAVNDFVDVLYFPDRRLFEAYGPGGAGAIAGADIPDGSITDAKLADMPPGNVKGRGVSAGTGPPTDVTGVTLANIAFGASANGDIIIGDTALGWRKLNSGGNNLFLKTVSGHPAWVNLTVSETSAGIAEIATQAETDAGTDDLRIVTPLKLFRYGKQDNGVCEGRLTLTTVTPVTTADVLAATTIYFTPYAGNRIALYDGTRWTPFTFTELSLSLSGFTANKNSDIFIYDNAGTLTLERTEWTNDTTRATALVSQDGVYVKSGATTRRYLGTFRTTATTGQCEDSITRRYVWNYYNRVSKTMSITEATSHTYNVATWRNWNNASLAQLYFVAGVSEGAILGTVVPVLIRISTDGNLSVGLGLNSTTAPINAGNIFSNTQVATLRGNAVNPALPIAGFNSLNVLEISSVGATAGTFNSVVAEAILQC